MRQNRRNWKQLVRDIWVLLNPMIPLPPTRERRQRFAGLVNRFTRFFKPLFHSRANLLWEVLHRTIELIKEPLPPPSEDEPAHIKRTRQWYNDMSVYLEGSELPSLYTAATRQWISEMIFAADAQSVKHVTSLWIDTVLNGKLAPGFTSLDFDTIQEDLNQKLQQKFGNQAIELIENCTFDTIQNILPHDNNLGLIHLQITEDATYAIITQKGKDSFVVELVNFKSTRINNLIRGWLWLYYWDNHSILRRLREDILNRNPNATDKQIEYTFYLPYRKMILSQALLDSYGTSEVPILNAKPSLPFPSWILMDVALRELGKLWHEIYQVLDDLGINRLIIIPHPIFAIFPHHATFYQEGIRREYLMKKYLISYLPAGQLKAQSRNLKTAKKILILNEDKLEIPSILEKYLLTTGDLFSSQKLKNYDDLVEKLARDIDTVVFVGHATYNWQNPENSVIRLANRVFTVTQLIDAVKQTQVQTIIFAACSIGMPSMRTKMSEIRGFAEDLLSKTSVRTVVSTSWSVNQISTLLLMKRFFICEKKRSELDLEIGITESLRNAQDWVRGLTRQKLFSEIKVLSKVKALTDTEQAILKTQLEMYDKDELQTSFPFAHPFFWAQFYVSGRDW